MRPIRSAVGAVNRLSVIPFAIAVLAVAACQPLAPPVPPDVQTVSTATPPQPFRDRKGWSVVVVPAALRERGHCIGGRVDGEGLRISFLGGDPDSGFRLSGFTADATPGATERLTARFDDGTERHFDSRVLPGPVLEAIFPTLRYDGTLYPFARAHSVMFEGQRLGPLGAIDLDGSSWTINATDECRRMHVNP